MPIIITSKCCLIKKIKHTHVQNSCGCWFLAVFGSHDVFIYWCADPSSSRSENPSTTEGPVFKLNSSKTGKPSSPQAQPSSASSESQQPPQTEDSRFRRVSGLLELGVICLPGTYIRLSIHHNILFGKIKLVVLIFKLLWAAFKVLVHWNDDFMIIILWFTRMFFVIFFTFCYVWFLYRHLLHSTVITV